MHFLFITALSITSSFSSNDRIPVGLAKQGWIASMKTIPPLPSFTAASGPRHKIDMKDPLEVFEKIFKVEFFKLLLSNAQPRAANKRNSLQLDEGTIAGLIAVELGMGLVGLHWQRDYWADEARTFGLFPSSFFRQFFSRKEFEEVKRRVEIDRDKGTEWTNKLSEKIWIPGQYVSTPCICARPFNTSNDRKIAVDEGILPGHHNNPSRSWVPGKPWPNGYEYLFMVDELGFLVHCIWEKPHQNKKYLRPGTMKEVVGVMAAQLVKISKLTKIGSQPFVFYLDSRFSSIEALKLLKSLGFYSVMSCGSVMAPRFLGQFLSGILKKKSKKGYKVDGKDYSYPAKLPEKMIIRQWRVAYNTQLESWFIVLQAKKSTVLYLLTNYGSPSPVITMHQRRKWPMGKFKVRSPQAQGEYNSKKNLVDNANRALLQYMPENRTETAEKKYVYICNTMRSNRLFVGTHGYLFKSSSNKSSFISSSLVT